MLNTRRNKRVALFVGVDEYDDKSIPQLSGAVADARELYEFFSSRQNQFDVAELLSNPTSSDLFEKVQSLSSQLKKGDFFLFYFAGHGVVDNNNQKLLCANTRRGRRSRLVNDFDLQHVAGVEKWDVAVILDACRTELDAMRGMGNRVGERRDLDFYDALLSSRSEGDASLTVLFSCDEGKTAGEMVGRNHGLFTYALLEVLKRADQMCRGWRFDQNLGEEIGRMMRAFADDDTEQRPWIKASGTPPLFFLPSLNLAPLKKKIADLLNANLISYAVAGECEKVLEGNSDKSSSKGIFEAIRFFSSWNEERARDEPCDGTLSILLDALCKTESNEKRRISSSKKIAAPNMVFSEDKKISEQYLSFQDKKLLKDVEKRFREFYGDDTQVVNLGRNTLSDAIDAIDAMARKHVRQACRTKLYQPLFDGEYDDWSVRARKGFSSPLEAAVYELVRDDKALAASRK